MDVFGNFSIAALLCALVAQWVGYFQISLMRKSHDVSLAKALPRIGCEVVSRTEQVLPAAFGPHTRIIVKIYNEGDARRPRKLQVNGSTCPTMLLRNVSSKFAGILLGNCENYTDSYLIEDSANSHGQGIAFDVHVEFFYTSVGEDTPQQYSAKYYYHRQSKRMIKRDYV